MLDSVKKAAKEEAKAEMQAQNNSLKTESSSTGNSAAVDETATSVAYKAGYEHGTSSICSLDDYTRNNDEYLKETFVRACQNGYDNMKEEYRSNRSMYKEFRRGLLKALEDAENAKNAL